MAPVLAKGIRNHQSDLLSSGSLSAIGLKTHSGHLWNRRTIPRLCCGNSGAAPAQASPDSPILCCRAGYSHLPGGLLSGSKPRSRWLRWTQPPHLLHPSPTVTQSRRQSQKLTLKILFIWSLSVTDYWSF